MAEKLKEKAGKRKFGTVGKSGSKNTSAVCFNMRQKLKGEKDKGAKKRISKFLSDFNCY